MCDSLNGNRSKKHSTAELINLQMNQKKRRFNVVQQITSREICANQHFPSSFVTKEPLKKFKLRKIVNEIGVGHVFLGFTKDGQFVISYSFQAEANDFLYPVYNYKLHWWHFVPNRALRLVSEVRLFGEQEICQDLHLLVCQWPCDETKILIYGFFRTDQLQQCYITITAVPSLVFCPSCTGLEEGKKLYPCLKHSFAIHTQYHTVPPFPEFVPTVCLKIDGSVIINTGDSLFALSVHVNMNSSTPQENEPKNTILQKSVTEQSTHVQEPISNNERVEKIHLPRPCYNNYNIISQDLTNEKVNISHNSYCTEELGKCSCSSHFDKDMSTYTLDQVIPNKEKTSCDRNSCVLNEHDWNKYSKDEASTSCNKTVCQEENCDDEYSFVETVESAKENISPCEGSFNDTDDGIKCCRNVKKDSATSLSVNNLLLCVTSVERVFVGNGSPIVFEEDEDFSNTGYHNCLPLEVHGSNYEDMRSLLQTHRNVTVKENIVIKQQTFDVEQFVHEIANRLCSNYGKKYLAVDDYDIQILDLDAETGDVTVLALILIKAACNAKSQIKTGNTSNFYQTKLVFVWNLLSGCSYMVFLLSFTECTDTSSKSEEHSRCSNVRTPHTLHHQLQKVRDNVPKPDMKSVKVLSNLPALMGSSLTSIVSPYHHIALVL